MQHLLFDEVVRRLVRATACATCYQRPAGSEALGPEKPRACEAACPLFLHLPKLIQLARVVDDSPGSCERAVCHSICGNCRLKTTAGPYCADYAARTCPLSRYSADVIGALQASGLVKLEAAQDVPPA